MIKNIINIKKYLFNIILGLIIFLGIYLRLKGYLSNSSLWHDECALAWNIKFKHYSDFFGILNYEQMAPPLFLVLTKFLTNIFGYSEYVFRFVPFIFGCASIPLFYVLSTKVLNKKANILLALFLFAVNTSMFNYSFEFKPYETDAFFTMACLLFFINLDMEKVSLKKSWIYGCLFSFLPWFSLVSGFTVVAGFLNVFFKNFKLQLRTQKNSKNDSFLRFFKSDFGSVSSGINGYPAADTGASRTMEDARKIFNFSAPSLNKKFALMAPFFISCLIYLKFYIINNYTNGNYLLNFWYKNFTDRGIKLFLLLIAKNIEYLFDPVKCVLFCLIFLFLGIILLFKEKSKFIHVSITAIILLIIASYFHIYPFAERLILFLLPLFLLYMVKPLDLVSGRRKILSVILILLFTASFYAQIGRTLSFITAKTFDRKEYPRQMMKFMFNKLKPGDIIYVNTSSNADYAYYASFYKIKNKVIQENIKPNISENNYITALNSLKPGYYWFFIPIDYITRPVSAWIEEWAQNQKILYYYKNGGRYKSLLLYIRTQKNPKNDSFLRFFKSGDESARTHISCGIDGGMGMDNGDARKIFNFSANYIKVK